MGVPKCRDVDARFQKRNEASLPKVFKIITAFLSVDRLSFILPLFRWYNTTPTSSPGVDIMHGIVHGIDITKGNEKARDNREQREHTSMHWVLNVYFC